MRLHSSLCLFLSLLALGAMPAHSSPHAYKTLEAGPALILTVPEGLCAYDHKHTYDEQMLATDSTTNQMGDKLLMGFSDCNDLQSMRVGKVSVNGTYGKMIVPLYLQGFEGDYSHPDVMKVIENYNYNRMGATKATAAEMTNRLNIAKIRKLPVGNELILGVTKNDEEHISIASLQYRRLPNMQVIPILSISSTILLSVPVIVTFSHPGDTMDVLDSLSAQTEAYEAQLKQFNKQSFFARIHHKKRLAAELGGAFVLLAGAAYWLRSRRRRGQATA
jgi:hypothetical protein